jgi:hypothetical protein
MITDSKTRSLDTEQSVYREHLLEHLLVGELLKHAWLEHDAELEVARPEVDRGGYDLVLEARQITRHVQLKASRRDASTSVQKVHVELAEKPSGCIVWIHFDPKTLALGPFFWFGGEAGLPLPDISGFQIAKHTKANAQGVKLERPRIRAIPKGKFRRIDSVEELYYNLFGGEPPVRTCDSPKAGTDSVALADFPVNKLNSVGKAVFVEHFHVFEAFAHGRIARHDCIEHLVSQGVSNQSGAAIRCGNAVLIFRAKMERKALQIIFASDRLPRDIVETASKLLTEI